MKNPIRTSRAAGVAAIVPAAGLGLRLGSRIPKPLVRLGGIPMAVRTLRALKGAYAFEVLMVVVPPPDIQRYRLMLTKYGLRAVRVIGGGLTRGDSVRNAVRELPGGVRWVLIHDVARPFIGFSEIRKTIRVARLGHACLLAERSKATVKESDASGGKVKKTLDRRRIFLAQTPQVFRLDWLEEAYAHFGKRLEGFTDEAALVEALGRKVFLVEGKSFNIKITTPADLKIAKALTR